MIPAVGTEDDAWQSDDETDDRQDTTGRVVETKASRMGRWNIAAICDARLWAIDTAFSDVCRRSFMVVVVHGEAAGCAVSVGKGIDRARHAHSNGKHQGVPVSPARATEDASVFRVVVRD